MHASDADYVDFIERALNHYNSIAVFYQFLILFIRASIFWKSLFLSENGYIYFSVSLDWQHITLLQLVACMVSYRESFLCLQLNIQSQITLLTTSNFRLMFVICFVADVAFMSFFNDSCSLLLLLILYLTLCWFLCILLVCDICCLCGLINTLINDSLEAENVLYHQIMYTFLLIITAVVVPLY